MKDFIAIDHSVADHHKFQDFDTLVEAQVHIRDNLPNGFAAPNPGGIKEFWKVDMVAKTITPDPASASSTLTKREAQDNIHRLESEVTPRRMRDHALGTGGDWLEDQEALIAIEREKL